MSRRFFLLTYILSILFHVVVFLAIVSLPRPTTAVIPAPDVYIDLVEMPRAPQPEAPPPRTEPEIEPPPAEPVVEAPEPEVEEPEIEEPEIEEPEIEKPEITEPETPAPEPAPETSPEPEEPVVNLSPTEPEPEEKTEPPKPEPPEEKPKPAAEKPPEKPAHKKPKVEKRVSKPKPPPPPKKEELIADAIARIRTQVKSEDSRQGISVQSPRTGIRERLAANMIDIYIAEIITRVQRNWAFSDQLGEGGDNLLTTVVFQVNADGTVKNVSIESKSGNPHLDASAYRAVLKSSPLPAHPKGIDETVIGVRLKFTPTGVR